MTKVAVSPFAKAVSPFAPPPAPADLAPASSTDDRAAHKLKKDAKRKERRKKEKVVKKQAGSTRPAVAGGGSGSATPASSAADGGLRVFVGRLPQQTTEENLRAHFGVCGAVVGVDMLVRRNNSRFKGAAFVQFETAAGVAAALELDGKEINGKAAAVQAASGAAAPAAAAAAGKADEPAAGASSVFVGNLPASVTEKDLRKVSQGRLPQSTKEQQLAVTVLHNPRRSRRASILRNSCSLRS